MTLDEYIALITSEHTGRPKFEATVAAGVSPLAKVQTVLKSLITELDIDSAIGVQLDKVGEWVGRSRRIGTPLVGVYFSWDSTEDDGFDSGVWRGQYDSEYGMVDLPDSAYRTLLKAKIASNRWSGSASDAYEVWSQSFGGESFVIIIDHGDMSITIGVVGVPLNVVEQALLTQGYLSLKPEGVRIREYWTIPTEGTMFAWDLENEFFGGWDSGQWFKSTIAI